MPQDVVQKAPEAEPVPDTVTISREDAEKIMRLFDILDSADTHYKSCQSAEYRSFVTSAFRAQKIQDAYEALRKNIR